MPGRIWVCLPAAVALFAAAGFAAAGTASAQSRPNDSAEQNVRASQQYESLVCSNPSFRAKRIAQECGPVTDPELHQSCVASFDCGPPKRGSQKAPPSETIR
jgi:hypothetical protein